jgi:hypothetical protein
MAAGDRDRPTLRLLSLGAGVQSTALALLSAEGDLLPRVDGAIFADTGWEPKAVYEHLARLEAVLPFPVYRVAKGNIRDDALDPAHRFASMPLYVRNQDGQEGRARRQCTSEYKLGPIKGKARELLGAPEGGRVPRGRVAETWVGISMDERDRALQDDTGALKRGDVQYQRLAYPLIETLGWSRADCEVYLRSRGWTSVAKSACIGCPFHGNAQWRDLRDNHPDEWEDAVEFDAAIRHGSARALALAQGQQLRGEGMYLHRSLLPLSVAPIDRVTRPERKAAQTDVLGVLREMEMEEMFPDVTGCSPFGCQRGDAA